MSAARPKREFQQKTERDARRATRLDAPSNGAKHQRSFNQTASSTTVQTPSDQAARVLHPSRDYCSAGIGKIGGRCELKTEK